MMEKVKLLIVHGWKGKLVSLFVALSIWYLIKSNLEKARQDFPVPGTAPLTPLRPGTGPVIDESILTPLIPAPAPAPGPAPAPLPLPVPGASPKG